MQYKILFIYLNLLIISLFNHNIICCKSYPQLLFSDTLRPWKSNTIEKPYSGECVWRTVWFMNNRQHRLYVFRRKRGYPQDGLCINLKGQTLIHIVGCNEKFNRVVLNFMLIWCGEVYNHLILNCLFCGQLVDNTGNFIGLR